MSKKNEIIYDSPASAPDDDFWLEQGRKMVVDSLPTMRSAATALTSALGVIQAVYLGILGFAKFVPEDWPVWRKGLFIVPLLCWLIALNCCVQVALTKKSTLYLHSPEHIQQISEQTILEKQRQLKCSYWFLVAGLMLAFLLLILLPYI